MSVSKTKVYGDPAVAARLQDARRAAGFKSARSAARAFGWSLHTYQAHESAARDLKAPDVARYAAALGVSADWISAGIGAPPTVPASKPVANASPFKELDDPEKMSAAVTLTLAAFAARRLVVARLLAGFESASAACRHYGWTRSTYGSHEGGRIPIPATWCDVYAAAYGVSSEWIRSGTDPAGLPGLAVEAVRREEKAAPWIRHSDGAISRAWDAASLSELLAPHVHPSRRGRVEDVQALLRRREVERSARVAASHASDIELVTGASQDSASRRDDLWGFPPGFLRRRLGAAPASTFAVPAIRDEPSGIARAGDVFIVDSSDTTPHDGYYVVSADGGGCLTYHRTDRRTRAASRAVQVTPPVEAAGRGMIIGRLVGLITKID